MSFSRRLVLLMVALFILGTVKANSSEILSERFEIKIKVKSMIEFFKGFGHQMILILRILKLQYHKMRVLLRTISGNSIKCLS